MKLTWLLSLDLFLYYFFSFRLDAEALPAPTHIEPSPRIVVFHVKEWQK